MSTCWVFVYDQQVAPDFWPPLTGSPKPATLNGFQRLWNIARDNSISLEKDRGFIDPNTQLKPPVAIAYLNIRPRRGSAINGMLLPISSRELTRLDSQKRLYERIDVSEKISPAVAGEVWVYRGRAGAEDCYKRFHRQGAAVFVQAALHQLEGAFHHWGDDELHAYKASTETPLLPVLPLIPLS